MKISKENLKRLLKEAFEQEPSSNERPSITEEEFREMIEGMEIAWEIYQNPYSGRRIEGLPTEPVAKAAWENKRKIFAISKIGTLADQISKKTNHTYINLLDLLHPRK